jgi:hypothetical protein
LISQSTGDVYLVGVSITILGHLYTFVGRNPPRGTAEKPEAFTHLARLPR